MAKPQPADIIPNQKVESQEIRCPGCGRFIGYQAIEKGAVRIICPNCKEWVTVEAET